MKELKSSKKSIIKKVFIKICRLLGYEIIDQSNFSIPTLNKSLNEKISIKGEKSINLPLGEVRITRKVKSLDVIIRTCSSVNMLTQSKKRIFEEEKIQYTLRSINSIVNRVKKDKIEEVIICTSVTTEGQTTAYYIQDSLKETNVKVSKLAQGLPVGGEIESLDDGTLFSAFKNRSSIISE